MSKRVLIIDDDIHFSQVLARSLERQGYQARVAANGEEALLQAREFSPQWITLDLRLEQESGLSLITQLKSLLPDSLIVMLTGYASIPTAVEAVKLGAYNYLHKPATLQELINAFGEHGPATELPEETDVMSVDRLEWEHIQRVLNEHQGNISATARALNMHRRTLQRKLQKYAPR
ncbi:MAG: response regulator transcription factor [Pseudomonadota bacterium]|nr:response regulator transcription factor [Pseudomonadota bacterium]